MSKRIYSSNLLGFKILTLQFDWYTNTTFSLNTTLSLVTLSSLGDSVSDSQLASKQWFCADRSWHTSRVQLLFLFIHLWSFDWLSQNDWHLPRCLLNINLQPVFTRFAMVILLFNHFPRCFRYWEEFANDGDARTNTITVGREKYCMEEIRGDQKPKGERTASEQRQS